MSKISVKTKLLNKTTNDIYDVETKAIKDNSIIKFYDDEILNVFDLENSCFERRNKEYTIKIDFKNNNGIYKLNNFSFDFEVKVKKLTKNDNYIEIDYIIYMDEIVEYNYRMEWQYD